MKKGILQDNPHECFLCGKNENFEPLDRHHVFEGQYRNKSEEYGLVVYLHHSSCHIFGKNSVHVNASVRNELKSYAQRKAMDKYKWTEEEFIHIFGKSYT